MSDAIRLQDLCPEQIRAALDASAMFWIPEVEYFLDDIGGLENAWAAVKMLEQLEGSF